jgi:two-component system, sensor histidine kinase and response regulator
MMTAVELQRPKVMIVDDNLGNLRLLEELLGEHDYDLLTFPRGDLAIKAASQDMPDLILLDINMPDMDGFEVCERLKADSNLRDIPVIFITAMSDMEDMVKAFATGGVDYVTKPFHYEEVLARIQTHLALRKQQMQLEDQFKQLQELEQLRDGLVHMIVHDMNNLLAGIVTSLGILKMRYSDVLTERGMRPLNLGLDSCQDLTSMVNDLLDISRLESGEMPVVASECNITDLIQDVVSQNESIIQTQAINVETPTREVRVSCDEHLIRRVLTNLIGNAIDFTSEGGDVLIGVENMPGAVRVTISDNGPGIPLEYQSRIFDKFGQVEARAKGEKHSTGLGLAFCKLAVEAHQGDIGVDSIPGNGSTFWFSVPSDPSGSRASV